MDQIKDRKKLGVIGGMGPEASCYYYENVIAHTKANSDQEHLDMVLLSHATMPDRTEAIMSGEDTRLITLLTEDARTLERLGAANIAITCNTSHYYYEQIQQAVHIPVIHMIRESVAYAVREIGGINKIGILATNGTINAGIYHKECERASVIPVSPSKERQRDVMSLIYDDIKCGKQGDAEKFNRALAELLEAGCDAVILACTELSVFKGRHEMPPYCLDAMDVLVRESVIRSGAEYQERMNR